MMLRMRTTVTWPIVPESALALVLALTLTRTLRS